MSETEFARFQSMLLNERSFDRLFCDVTSSKNYDLYYNQSFSEDPVFNHAVIADSILNSNELVDKEFAFNLVEEIKIEAVRRNIKPSIFVERFRKSAQLLEGAAVENNYIVAGSMCILSKEVSTGEAQLDFGGIDLVETADFRLWNEAFMRSYRIPPEWEAELLKREEMFTASQSATLFIARDADHALAGCILLHKFPDDLLGIYCVGTVPEKRNRGIARAMLWKAEEYALRQGCRYLTLQTIVSDGVTPMYVNLGFRIEFERDILQMP